ncbi:hypothetical protein F5B22DRAFT_584534 [Xylaria bambusicola]|uniref:uncharacterized protein n=1 Tax=Xylaria bambusicola TaxID=326684 RepID=UPI0020088618|nr:uncharacterized protein F5B22DRAFT_584534 [Xylaria bambusicola]KAI0528299.1 hypothetical protein F5B22DRAFT_584534 [Xylaria bambusicola]
MDVLTDTGTELAREWANPSVAVAIVLMFVGGNVIREAFAQSTGKLLTPVCFSFGWVAYALSSLKDTFGEGRLLSLTDYPVKVFNLDSGYYRVNKNWLIGRILRDHEESMSKNDLFNDSAIRIAIFEAMPVNQRGTLSFQYNTRHLLGGVVMVAQLVIAAIPTIRTQGNEWGILAITGFGTFLSLVMGSLPQWWAEKMPSNQSSKKVFALTGGNGSRDIMIIKGEGRCLDLEELATMGSPRTTRIWSKLKAMSVPRSDQRGRDAKTFLGRPIGFLITQCVCILEAVGWFLILTSLAGIRSHTWCLIVIGTMGWVHNVMLADLTREPKSRNLPLKLLDTISTYKTMDGLMDLEVTHAGCGEALLPEFFPGRLRPDEEEWWREKERRSETKYDRTRFANRRRRLCPRSMLPSYNLHATAADPTVPNTPPEESSLWIEQQSPKLPAWD